MRAAAAERRKKIEEAKAAAALAAAAVEAPSSQEQGGPSHRHQEAEEVKGGQSETSFETKKGGASTIPRAQPVTTSSEVPRSPRGGRRPRFSEGSHNQGISPWDSDDMDEGEQPAHARSRAYSHDGGAAKQRPAPRPLKLKSRGHLSPSPSLELGVKKTTARTKTNRNTTNDDHLLLGPESPNEATGLTWGGHTAQHRKFMSRVLHKIS